MEHARNSLYTLLLLVMISITLLQYYYVSPEFSNQNSACSPRQFIPLHQQQLAATENV